MAAATASFCRSLARICVIAGLKRGTMAGLGGSQEAGAAFGGGEEGGVRERQTETGAMIAVAVEEDGRGRSRIRMRRIPDALSESLTPFIEDSAEPGSVVHTDGWPGDQPLESGNCRHRVAVLKGNSQTAPEATPRVQLAVAPRERRLPGTHPGGGSPGDWDADLGEFTFRFNRRKSRSRGKPFYRLLQQAFAVDPVPCKSPVQCFAVPDF
ncbi:MAG: transposase [Terracidiphilus sp.]